MPTGRELIAEITSRQLSITPRSLEFWTYRRLIPRPRRAGLGRGRGTEEQWPEAVVEQLDTLIRLRRRHRALDRVALLLWLAGFDLDHGVIRRAVDRQLVQLKKVFLGKKWNVRMRADAQSKAAVKAAKARGALREVVTDHDVRADFVEFVLAAFMGPKGYEPSDAMPGVVTSALAALGLVDAVTAAPVADHHLHEMMGALNLDRLREHIASASTEQLDYGRTAYWAFRQLFPTVLNQPVAEGHRPEAY